jgi:hypothetical protein
MHFGVLLQRTPKIGIIQASAQHVKQVEMFILNSPRCADTGGILLKTEFSTELQAAGVNGSAYAAILPGGQTSVIILNKDAAADLEVELDFGRGMSGAVETETLHAPGLNSREAYITRSTKTDSLKRGKCSAIVPHATGLRLTVV